MLLEPPNKTDTNTYFTGGTPSLSTRPSKRQLSVPLSLSQLADVSQERWDEQPRAMSPDGSEFYGACSTGLNSVLERQIPMHDTSKAPEHTATSMLSSSAVPRSIGGEAAKRPLYMYPRTDASDPSSRRAPSGSIRRNTGHFDLSRAGRKQSSASSLTGSSGIAQSSLSPSSSHKQVHCGPPSDEGYRTVVQEDTNGVNSDSDDEGGFVMPTRRVRSMPPPK